jgi:hypothetical protein|tara:strand:+ start:286 stop:534 length:249 start_codon:yes stop_codon:yes gene_type:complete
MIRKTTPASEIVINLDGPNGNAFYLLKIAKQYAHSMGMKASPIMSEMCSGTDYYKLVKVFEKHFGHLVVLETSNEELLEYIS